MNLKKLITESVIEESINMVSEELADLKKYMVEQMIMEGVDDPGILKMIFMAGGPGSGKSYTSADIFGVAKGDMEKLDSTFSATGLK